MSKLITATFKTRAAAEDVIHRLESIGVTNEQISLVVTDETRGNSFNIEEGTKADEGFAAGATAGGLIGALVGSGFKEHEAKIFENEVKSGAILIAVKAKDGDQKDQIEDIFENADAYNLAA